VITEPDSLEFSLSLENASCDIGGSAATQVTGGTTPYSYLWSGGEQTASIGPVASGSYSVTVTDARQCTRSETFDIAEDTCLEMTLFIPGSFSPNGDGRNDFFTASGIHFNNFSMEIFDRWGKPLFHTDDLNHPWYGTTEDGNAVPMGVYVYQVKVIDLENTPHEYVGSVTLFR